jgi:5-methylcytosine-specific restriction endonuclease McrA
VPPGDLDSVFRMGLELLVAKLERQKFAATDKPRVGKPSKSPRNIPAHVKRAVWQRDGGRCTFVGDGGHRCEARRDLEYDHDLPVARGGEATVGNIRLRCRAHNQLEADREFGAEFMKNRRFARSA